MRWRAFVSRSIEYAIKEQWGKYLWLGLGDIRDLWDPGPAVQRKAIGASQESCAGVLFLIAQHNLFLYLSFSICFDIVSRDSAKDTTGKSGGVYPISLTQKDMMHPSAFGLSQKTCDYQETVFSSNIRKYVLNKWGNICEHLKSKDQFCLITYHRGWFSLCTSHLAGNLVPITQRECFHICCRFPAMWWLFANVSC